MKDIKDWTKTIDGLNDMEGDAVVNLYSEILASAHDIGYKVPDDCLIESEDPEALRKVIAPLHDGLVKFNAAAKADAKSKAKAAAKAPKPIKEKKTAPTKPAKVVEQKEAKEKTMATTAKKAAPAKKAAKAKAPAKKAPAAKKAAKANARTGVARNPFGDNAVIKVLNKENPARADSERGKRIAAVFKMNGKKVSEFYKLPAPLNRTDTLRFLIDRKFISVK